MLKAGGLNRARAAAGNVTKCDAAMPEAELGSTEYDVNGG
jgi:hypothetical protein